MSARASDCENIVFCKWLKSYKLSSCFSCVFSPSQVR